jgi:hypothetical protein
MPRGIYDHTNKPGQFKKGHQINTGLKRSEETKLKIRALHIGKKRSEESKLRMSVSHIGVPLSEEHKNALRLARKKGHESHNWIKDRTKIKTGDRSFNDPLQKQWSLDVKKRDKWSCRIADINCEGRLEAHHILSWKDYPELRYEVNNGITLCHHHHPKKRIDVEKLSPYFQELVASLD